MLRVLTLTLHSLWGGANHLKAADEMVQSCVSSPNEEIHTIRPKTSSLFKTYDGIEMIGDRMLVEIIAKINDLHGENVVVTKISFIGYSLGGLVSRYVIGELEKKKIFDDIEPMFFCTFASPHLGVQFFRRRSMILNFLGSQVLGLVGSELFIKDRSKILVKLASDEYLEGLGKFKERFCFANIRHDRTVSFYSAYITDKNPFDAHWDSIELSFDFEDGILPTYRVHGVDVKPRFVNIAKSNFVGPGRVFRKKSLRKKLRFIGIILAASVILPIWIPVVLTASTIASIVSYFIVSTHKKVEFEDLKRPDSSKLSAGFEERLQEATGEAFENAINIGQYDANTDWDETSHGDSIATLTPIESVKAVDAEFENRPIAASVIFHDTKPLALNADRQYINEKLNSLVWSKFAVYVNVLNAHDGIIARKGLKRSTAKGIAVIRFYAELINKKLNSQAE